ncbi:hypothetical protein LX32DRAFT_326747 [Colletotrichum zoysiae]|uniref:Uncharacterized protein n=1 Tax=Colletotrichum zoysiae TaxID=1216348 RepID=A0AAD9HJY6_9PEZI|nr:hypothetical protein LX32DRAFT_326747 [Colletotrichum zoysiae]
MFLRGTESSTNDPPPPLFQSLPRSWFGVPSGCALALHAKHLGPQNCPGEPLFVRFRSQTQAVGVPLAPPLLSKRGISPKKKY